MNHLEHLAIAVVALLGFWWLDYNSKRRDVKIMSDLTNLKDEVEKTVAAEEAVLTKIQELEAQLASSTDQAEIDALTKQLADERAKIEAQP